MTDEIAIARFSRNKSPDTTKLADCLEAAKKEIEDGSWDHVIVLFGRTTDEGASGTKFYQAGVYPHHGQMGLCQEGMLMIRESGQ